MPEPLLEIRDLCVSFRTEAGLVRAVDGISLSIGLGEVVGIVGESGSGKTISMLAVMRLIRDPNAVIEGQVFLRGRDLGTLSPQEMRRVRGGEIPTSASSSMLRARACRLLMLSCARSCSAICQPTL